MPASLGDITVIGGNGVLITGGSSEKRYSHQSDSAWREINQTMNPLIAITYNFQTDRTNVGGIAWPVSPCGEHYTPFLLCQGRPSLKSKPKKTLDIPSLRAIELRGRRHPGFLQAL